MGKNIKVVYPICIFCKEIILLTSVFLNQEYQLYLSYQCKCNSNTIISFQKYYDLINYYSNLSLKIPCLSFINLKYCIKCACFNRLNSRKINVPYFALIKRNLYLIA